MRVERLLADGRNATDQMTFARWVLDVGDGVSGDFVRLPHRILSPTTDPLDLIHDIFGDFNNPANRTKEALTLRCLLAALNKDTRFLNALMTDMWPGRAMVYQSADQVCLCMHMCVHMCPSVCMHMHVCACLHACVRMCACVRALCMSPPTMCIINTSHHLFLPTVRGAHTSASNMPVTPPSRPSIPLHVLHVLS